MNWLKGKKTYLVAAGLAYVSFVEVIYGDRTLSGWLASDDVVTLFQAMGLAAVRAGIAKVAAEVYSFIGGDRSGV
ncbi:MAG: hypothetical protein GWO11_05220 [Desulfuromonadales bacterium]|nr:hypothetical protein [Desulfuromonadales bacterium]